MKGKTESLIQSPEFLRNVFRGAVIPGLISYFTSNLALLADGILVGRYVGLDGLAAMSLGTPIVLSLNVFGSLWACGAETLCSKALGQNREEKAQRYYSDHLALSLLFSGLFILIGLFFVEPTAIFLCRGDAHLAPLVKDYLRVYLLMAPTIIFTFPPFWFLPLEGKNSSVTVMMVIMGVLNIFLDVLFLAVMHMGVAGAALGSTLACGASALYGMTAMHQGTHSFTLTLSWPKWREWKELATAGSPEAVINLFLSFRSLAINRMLLQVAGNTMVAQYMVLTSIASISDAVTVGIPQAGTAIEGVYSGERDNQSIVILLRAQLRVGLIGSVVLGLLLGFGTPVIEWAYHVEQMALPIWMLSLSLFPVMLTNILTSYYRVSGHEMLANVLIVLRTYVFCILSLAILDVLHASVWLHMVIEVLLTLLAWSAITWVISKRSRDPVSRWLLMDKSLEDRGTSINFSIKSDIAAICDASERISGFCEANQLPRNQSMRVSLALEEMMTLITQFNPDVDITFDVRVFAIQGVIGLRFRYKGEDFNPLSEQYQDDDRFMGIQMVRNLVEETVYQRIFGINSLLILIEKPMDQDSFLA